MPPAHSLDQLIASLGDDLKPVKRLRPPLVRAAAWIAVVLAIAAVLGCFADWPAVAHRIMSTPDMALAAAGSTLTAVLAALAVFQLSVPGRSARWALLPLPSLALWIGASGLGCLRTWIPEASQSASMAEGRGCFVFIVGLSLPLTALTVLMIRRAFPVRPNLTALVGGLAIASAAASLLNLFHPYDASVGDLVMHLAAVLVVIGLNQLLTPQIRRR